MSDTRKGQKSTGYEYWGKRPGTKPHGAEPGPFTKRKTHRAERREGKRQIVREDDL